VNILLVEWKGVCILKAVILAAGQGTRLGDLTKEIPKPMIKIGEHSCLEWILMGIRDAGVEDFVIVTGYLGNMIQEAFGDGHRFGVNITYLQQEKQLGTGHALNITRDVVDGEPVIMSYGDILIPSGNYSNMLQRFSSGKHDALLALKWVEDPYRGAAVYIDENCQITQIIEKPEKGTSRTNWNNAGIYVFAPVIYKYTAKIKLSPRGEYELPDAISMMLADGYSIAGYCLDGYWADIGTPKDVEQMSRLLSKNEDS
jgi:dTDP-glucose pyrophosphorylase